MNGEGQLACTVVGTGNMGTALASALLGAGNSVTVWNRTPSRYAPLLARGAVTAESLSAAISGADLVVVCLLDYPTTTAVFAADGVGKALAGATVLQFSFSSGPEAEAFQSWVLRHRGTHLHGQIKAYPREIGTPGALLTYSGSRMTFESLRATLTTFGEAVYLGRDVAAACVVSNAAALFYELVVMACFECAAYVNVAGADPEIFESLIPPALRLAVETIDYSMFQINEGVFTGDEASIDTHANAVSTALSTVAASDLPALAVALRGYLAEAQSRGFGSLAISAVQRMLVDSLSASPTAKLSS